MGRCCRHDPGQPMNKGQAYTLVNEGKRHQTYDDATGESIGKDGRGVTSGKPLAGTLTIGVGHTGHDFAPGDIWDDTRIMYEFDGDYHKAVEGAYNLIRNGAWNMIGEARQAALIDMVFELGADGVKGFSLMLNNLRSHNYAAVAHEVMASKYATEAPTRALHNSVMMQTGEWL
jgi:GH24 family phage-related lysozyme (muramidase)